MNLLVETLMSKLIYLIMQQKLIEKNVSPVDVSSFALKSNLASLKTEVNKLEIDKLVPVPVTKVDNTNIQVLLKKTKYEKDGSDFEDKINKIDKKYRI